MSLKIPMNKVKHIVSGAKDNSSSGIQYEMNLDEDSPNILMFKKGYFIIPFKFKPPQTEKIQNICPHGQSSYK